MPRGGRPKKTHKGQRRHFTNEEDRELEEEKKRKEKEWRKQKGIASDESEEESGDERKAGEAGEARAAPKPRPLYPASESESESDSEEEKETKKKGVEGLIDIENPNRVIQKAKKVTEIDVNSVGKSQLSRREREEIAKQQAAAHYRKMHEAGKTEEAQSDLARLAIIRKQREEQAKKRDAEIQAKEAAKIDAEKKLLAKKRAAKS